MFNPFRRAPTVLMKEFDVQRQGPLDVYAQRPDTWNAYFPSTVGGKFVSLKPNQSERSTAMITPYMNDPGVKGSYKQHSSAAVNPHVFLRHGSGTPGIPGGVPLANQVSDARMRPDMRGGPGVVLAAPPIGGTIYGIVDN